MFNIDRFEERASHWANIIAVIPGAYCGYEVFEQKGHSMTAPSPLVFSAVFFLICIGVGGVTNVMRRKAKPIPANVPVDAPLVAPVETAGTVEMFTPLQKDALSLALNLLDFIKAQGEPPKPKYTREQIERMSSEDTGRLIRANDKDFDFACEYWFGGADGVQDGVRTEDQLAKLLMARFRLLDPWYEKVTAGYELEYRQEVERMRHRFALEGLSDDNLLQVPIQGKLGRENIKSIAAKLWELAYKVREKGVVIENA